MTSPEIGLRPLDSSRASFLLKKTNGGRDRCRVKLGQNKMGKQTKSSYSLTKKAKVSRFPIHDLEVSKIAASKTLAIIFVLQSAPFEGF